MCKGHLRALAILVALLVTTGAAWGERFESEDAASNIVVGTIKTVNARWGLGFDVLGSYVFRYYEAGVEVEAADKGTGIQPGQTVQVLYCRKMWVPLSPAIVLMLALVGVRILVRVQCTWLRWTLRSVLVVVALLLALSTAPLPGMYGHHDFPSEGERVRAFLKVNSAGGYEGLYPSWAKVMPEGRPE
jgi:hypothetical protein